MSTSPVWVKYRAHEMPEKLLTVKVNIAPNGAYDIKGAKVTTEKSKNNREVEEFDQDLFSSGLKKHGFDEDDVRISIEETLDEMQKNQDPL